MYPPLSVRLIRRIAEKHDYVIVSKANHQRSWNQRGVIEFLRTRIDVLETEANLLREAREYIVDLELKQDVLVRIAQDYQQKLIEKETGL